MSENNSAVSLKKHKRQIFPEPPNRQKHSKNVQCIKDYSLYPAYNHLLHRIHTNALYNEELYFTLIFPKLYYINEFWQSEGF